MPISDWFARWGRRVQEAAPPIDVARAAAEPEPVAAPDPGTGPGQPTAADIVYPTRALGRLVETLRSRPSPVVLDLGAAIGSNIAYFGERVGGRMLVADLAAEIERRPASADDETLAASLAAWFTQPDESVDGVLFWDLFDFLEPVSAAVVAREVSRMLSADGVAFGMFRTVPSPAHHYSRWIIVDETRVCRRPYGSPCREAGVLENREIIRLFADLRVSDSFHLPSHVREILFWKPQYLTRRPR